MSYIETITTIERTEANMAEATTRTTISRRPARPFMGEQGLRETGIDGQMERESQHPSEEKEQERSQKAPKPQKRPPSTNNIEAPIIPLVDFGKDFYGIFPSTLEDMDDHGMLLERSLNDEPSTIFMC
jgi:hypothetical protein